MMGLVTREADVVRYFVREPFNPGSSKQLLAYMKAKGHTPGRNHKTGADSTDADTLERLARKDPFFKKVLEYREVQKIKNTYVAPNLARADEESRIHSQFLHAPSNMRLSSVEPNLQNIPDEDDELSLARKFRHCIVASPGCLLVEADFNAIEAVLTGYFCGDLNLMRLASMGVHSYVVAQVLNLPVSLDWPDAQLAEALAKIKSTHKSSKEYRACKAAVHLTHYGGSPTMMYKAHPDVFDSIASAQRIQATYLSLCPTLGPWQKGLRDRAAKEHCLGGNDHPFHYKHWFWDVTAYDARRGVVPGSDWNKVVAFYPASTAAGVLYESVLRLVDPASPWYVGDLYHGRTPIRSLIHDSILAEIPEEHLPLFTHRLVSSMTAPVKQLPYKNEEGLNTYLSFGVDVKVGKDWGSMRPLKDHNKVLPFTKEKHSKHHTGDYCTFCRAQWPCEEETTNVER